jgi:hypothetical protein
METKSELFILRKVWFFKSEITLSTRLARRAMSHNIFTNQKDIKNDVYYLYNKPKKLRPMQIPLSSTFQHPSIMICRKVDLEDANRNGSRLLRLGDHNMEDSILQYGLDIILLDSLRECEFATECADLAF